ncbi:MAG: ABC transporter ATP-binding protein [Armatimonadota bacterium]|nr:ABC transporter ATP-binding protein [Armatimonadota bacterium]
MRSTHPLSVSVTDLTVRYHDGRLALENVSFRVGAGESVAILGANGAGKSTLLLALVGVIWAQGRVSFGDLTLSPKTLRDVRRRVQLVFQEPDDQLFMPFVRDDVAFGPLNFGVPAEDVRTIVKKALDSVGLTGFENRNPHALSLGEKKRVAIAAALACKPQVLLLDEPSAGLDAPGRRQLAEVLRSLEATKLIATHDLDFASAVCERAIVLKCGRVRSEGAIESLLADEAMLYDCGLR